MFDLIEKAFINEILKDVPTMDECEDEDLKIYLRFTHPLNDWEWFVAGYDVRYDYCYGYVRSFENEWGNFTMKELEDNGCMVDMRFRPCRFSEIARY